jgi:hypothetical protein
MCKCVTDLLCVQSVLNSSSTCTNIYVLKPRSDGVPGLKLCRRRSFIQHPHQLAFSLRSDCSVLRMFTFTFAGSETM